MEYVVVECNQCFKVLIDDQENGRTGETLRVSAGKHTFSLVEALNCTPKEITAIITGTSVITPHIIKFEV